MLSNTLKAELLLFEYYSHFSSTGSSHQRCSIQIDVLRNFAKFTEKHLCQSLFFNNVADNIIMLLEQDTPEIDDGVID